MVFLITQEVLWFFTYILFNFQRTMFSCVLLSQATCLSYHPPKLSVFPYNSIQEDYPLYPPIFTKSHGFPREDTHGLVFGNSSFFRLLKHKNALISRMILLKFIIKFVLYCFTALFSIITTSF